MILYRHKSIHPLVDSAVTCEAEFISIGKSVGTGRYTDADGLHCNCAGRAILIETYEPTANGLQAASTANLRQK